MANRSAAAIFSVAFEACAAEVEREDEPNEILLLTTADRIARKLWQETKDYDFTDDQMGCDKALLKLGLAKMVMVGDPLEGEGVVYLQPDGSFE